MTDRPIIFSAPMIKALLDGRKSQTRRVLTGKSGIAAAHSVERIGAHWIACEYDRRWPLRLPYAPGGRLWVREAHALVPSSAYRMSDGVAQAIDPADADSACVYREGWERCAPRWRPSIHMPRWASRLTLVVTDVRVTRLHDIIRGDAMAEGCPFSNMAAGPDPREWFRDLWNSIHGPEAWAANPWVAALTFKTHRCNIDKMPEGV